MRLIDLVEVILLFLLPQPKGHGYKTKKRFMKIKQNFLIIFFLLFAAANLFPQVFKDEEKEKVRLLIQQFNDEDSWINGDAINKLAEIGEPAVDDLIIALQDKNENARWCASIVLEKIAPLGKQSIPFLVATLKDENANVRYCSALALRKYGTDAASAIHELQKLLYDNDHDVRWAAYISLSMIDQKSLNVIPVLSEKIKIVEKLIPDLMSELNVPGVSISLIDNKQTVYQKSFGMADANKKNPVDENTMFEACSMSKPVFALIVLQLVERGKLDLDKPLYNYLPEKFVSDDENYAKQITARMILTHSSGMPNWRKGDEERNPPIPVYFKPGLRFNYSGEGFYYLQRVVEKITNQSLEAYAQDNLFNKLGLVSTSFVWEEKFDKQIATGHDADGNSKERKRYLHSNAAYTLYSTSNDYAKLVIEILESLNEKQSMFSQELIGEMISHQLRVDTRDVIDRPGRNFGLFAFRSLGWAIDSTITGDVVYHSGANQTGFRCYSQFSPKDNSGIVIMTNGNNGSELWERLLKVIGDL